MDVVVCHRGGGLLQQVDVGCYARIAGGEKIVWDGEARLHLRRFVQPTPPIDLNQGFESFIAKRLTLAVDEERLLMARRRYGGDYNFVTFRNNLNKVCQTPYSNEPWEMGVRRTEEGVVLSVRRQEDPRRDVDPCEYYGYAFEAASTGSALEAVDPNEEFVRCVRLSVGRHVLFVAAEIDCSDGDYVELKTTRLLETQRQVRTFERYKLLRFWIQSYLVNVPTIVCGFRDDAGILRDVQQMRTSDLPRFGEKYWSRDVVLGFLAEVLDFLQGSLAQAPANEDTFDLVYNPTDRSLVLSSRNTSGAVKTKKLRSE